LSLAFLHGSPLLVILIPEDNRSRMIRLPSEVKFQAKTLDCEARYS